MDTASRPESRQAALPLLSKRALAGLVMIVCVTPAVLYVAISAVLADRLSRPDRRPVVGTPADYGLAYERVSFNSAVDQIPLEGWYIDSPGSKVIVMLHGRNGVRNDSDGTALEIARALAQHNYDVLMFDFRAHGQSGGERYSLGEFEVRDVAGALDYLKTRGVSEVGTLGSSMGAATALNAAPDHPEMRAVVSDSAFADANLLMEAQLPVQARVPSFFAPGLTVMVRVLYGIDLANNQPQRQVARLGNRALFLIHGTQDNLIPVSHVEALQNAAASNPNLRVWIVPGAQHAGAYAHNREEYLARVIGFFDENLE